MASVDLGSRTFVATNRTFIELTGKARRQWFVRLTADSSWLASDGGKGSLRLDGESLW